MSTVGTHYLNSSAIYAVNYITAKGDVAVQFISSGPWFDYFNVPDSVYRGLLAVSSKGRYFNAHIRDRYAA